MLPLLLVLAVANVDPRVVSAIEGFDRAYRKLHTLTYLMKKEERMRDGTIVKEAAFIKFRKPGDLYLSAREPRVGQEVLYLPKRDAKNLRVHPGNFPDLTLNLAVHGDLALKNQHHPVYHTDPGYTLNIVLASLRATLQENGTGTGVYIGEQTRVGRPVVVVELTAGDAKPSEVAAIKGERLIDFAIRNGVDPYSTYAVNPKVAALTAKLEEGRMYLVPVYYGYRTQLAFDKDNGFLIDNTTWNQDGTIYEHLCRADLVLDAPVSDIDFDDKNPAYHF